MGVGEHSRGRYIITKSITAGLDHNLGTGWCSIAICGVWTRLG